MFGIQVEFLDFSFLDNFTIILLTLLSTPTTLLLLALNTFGAKFDNSIFFNNKISNVTIILRP